jgi:hypothetical protein
MHPHEVEDPRTDQDMRNNHADQCPVMAMSATLRQAVPQLIDLSPTLTEALSEIEATIQTIGGIAEIQRYREDLQLKSHTLPINHHLSPNH